MHGLKAAQGKMGIDLRGRDVRMTQECLDTAQVGAMFDHVRCATVTKHVWARTMMMPLDQRPYPLTCQLGTSCRNEEVAQMTFVPQ